MEGNYPIYRAGKIVGQARITGEGLYYRIRCRCSRSWDVVSRIYVTSGEKTESLGIPVPEGEEFLLDTRLPRKKLGTERPRFAVQSDRVEPDEMFVPICPEEPFAYLSRLRNAYAAKRDGQIGVVIRK